MTRRPGDTVTAPGRVRGTDGKRYPAAPLPRQELNRRRWMSHHLVHRDQISIRGAQRIMLDRYGIRRSVGSIARDLALWECPHCPHLNN